MDPVQPNSSVPDESIIMNDGSGFSNATPNVQTTTTTTTSQTPPPNPVPTASDSGTAKPKTKGKIIATIFGLFFLVAAIGAGIVLVNQRQFTNQEAAAQPTCYGQLSITCHSIAMGPDNSNGMTQQVKCSDGNASKADCMLKNQYSTDPTLTCTGNKTPCTWGVEPPQTCKAGAVITCGCDNDPKKGTCEGVSGCVRQDGCGSTSTVPNFVGCGTNDKLDAVGPAGHGGCQNCFKNSNGVVSCQNQSTSCGAKTECQSGNGGGSNGGSTTPAACSGDCITTYNGKDLTDAGSNCGEVGRPEGSGSCSNGGRCCNAPGSGTGTTPSEPTTRTCGEACSTDTECQRGNSASVCRNKVCVNVNCPTQTQAGKNCACLNTVACGQQPLFGQKCGTGSEHGFINVPGNTCAKYEVTSGSNGPKGYEYCIPSSPTHGYKYAASCTDLQVRRLAKSDGSVTGLTQQDVLTACSPEATATPTPTGGPTAACSNIAAYDSSWNPLTPDQLSKLAVGSKVRFAVAGTTSSGSFDMARFTINGVLQQNTTLVRPSSSDFYYEYTVPAGTTSFSITAQIHQSQLNQWY